MPEEEIDTPGPGEVVPKEIRSAVFVIMVEAVALLAGAAVLIIKTVTGHPSDVAGALLGAAFAVGAAAVLYLAGRGLARLQPAARTPIVVIELLALPVSYSLAFQAGLVEYGGPILLAALAVLYLLFTPAARAALDR
ncbi:hypothetical protein [Jatrophihabitans sp.]|uniref:hypothetical protein n=1 Tax=Jatrophihabitans sp. TaxID=1932789 RepID=UPI0030C7090B|nr:conserved rane protein of unknown function [Jatrophihabitans sp.]